MADEPRAASLTYRRVVDVEFSRLGAETVLLHLGKGMYFGLDSVGTRVWELMDKGATLERLCDELGREYDVELASLRHDLAQLLNHLVAEDLIVARAEG
jgi:hypothetical protein